MGNMLATGDREGKISIWSKNFEHKFHLKNHANYVRDLVFNKDESKLYSTGDNNCIIVCLK